MPSSVDNRNNNIRSSNRKYNNPSSGDHNNNNSGKMMHNNNDLLTHFHSLDSHANSGPTSVTMEADAATTTTTTTTAGASPPDFDFNLPCRYFKSSFARSLSLGNAGGLCKSLDYEQRGGGGGVGVGVGVGNGYNKNNCPPLPQRLSRAPTPAAGVDTKNEVAAGGERPPAIPARRLPAKAGGHLDASQQQQRQQQQQHQQQQHVPLTQFRIAASGRALHRAAHQKSPQSPGGAATNRNLNYNNSNGSSIVDSGRRNTGSGVWPRDSVAIEQDGDDLSDEAVDHELTKISSADYAMSQQQQQQPQPLHQHHQQQPHHPPHHLPPQPPHLRPAFEPQEESVNVEAVLLQNQVDTLQWQLKQVETSCEMYRAVMEEVARFLDRYHSQRQQPSHHNSSGHMEQISRSKSMHHVYGGGVDDKAADCSDAAAPAVGYLRTRSSTNLIDLKPPTTTPTKAATRAKLAAGGGDERHLDGAHSYSAFKDFTWRRSPKKPSDSRALCSAADVEEKLNQEAFRLSRTIHNLLNTSTQQPDLTQHRCSSLAAAGLGLGRLGKAPAAVSASVLTLHQPLHNSTSLAAAGGGPSTLGVGVGAGGGGSGSSDSSSSAPTPKSVEMLFLRSLNMRDSRLSLRSSTDSSVHSTTSSSSSSGSSKVETDEDHSPFHSGLPSPPPPPLPQSAPKPIPRSTPGSATEDESGFSSISSFQDIGLPLSSTMISDHREERGEAGPEEQPAVASANGNGVDFLVDSRNSTLKAPAHPTNVVGVPLRAAHDMQHRWDSPAKALRATPSKFQQRFSTLSNEDSSTVLWV